ncbi:hypothetical protein BKA67DRAFT_660883 [Truncatella angustata]|uniref:Uncharacterized protein n=1 Tax=Truncatella angustata TaxID=152316 RepID=A0A9P8ZWM3_9PEZI|nr:uncharacterized protein BKA67DRAFT_660883 [Truncatella angustata]KAH6652113.1 hypothetical protein BKA67DRAFT_660883 [Truncatella angustata]
MRYVALLQVLAAIFSHSSGTDHELVRQEADNDTFIQICPNQYYEAINDTLTCMNISNPAELGGYGRRNCFSLTYTPLRVGSPQGISSARIFGRPLNCTLYKTENCLPDSPENGYIIPPTGASTLPLPTKTDDAYAMDDKSQAFECRNVEEPNVVVSRSVGRF